MKKDLIVGSGLSAFITKILTKKKSKIIGLCNHKDIIKSKYLIRRDKLEKNKFLSKKAFSFGSLYWNVKKGTLHDRLTNGGNSNIWGGHISLKNISKSIIKVLQKKKIKFEILNLKKTGSISNNKNIAQMQTFNNKIFSTKDNSIKIKNGYLDSIIANKKKLFVKILLAENKIKNFEINKIYLCVGLIQLIDLLYRSKFIKNGDIIELSEFLHKFKINHVKSKFVTNNITIRYSLSSAINHLLGIQYYSKIFKLLDLIPLCIDQNFYYKKIKFRFKINTGIVNEITKRNNLNYSFGSSIHYCNMKINNIKVRKFLKKINPNIHGFGMPFVNQQNPGPISNDIIKDIFNEINKLKIS